MDTVRFMFTLQVRHDVLFKGLDRSGSPDTLSGSGFEFDLNTVLAVFAPQARPDVLFLQ